MKEFKNFLFLFTILISLRSFSFAQKSKIDSLYTVLRTLNLPHSFSEKSEEVLDTIRINTLHALAWELKNSNTETAIILSTQALNLSITIFKSEGNKSPLGKIRNRCIDKSYHQLGIFNYLKGNNSLALSNYLKALKIRESLNDKVGISKTLGNIGLVYNSQGNSTKALDCYFRALKIAEESKDENEISRHLGNIANIYNEQKNYAKALDYYIKALKMAEDLKNKNLIATDLGNIGLIYLVKNDYSEALNYFSKALKLDEELGNINGTVHHINNIGIVYAEQASKDSTKHRLQLFNTALYYYIKALKITEKLGDKDDIGVSYANIGNVYIHIKNYTLAEKYLQKAIKLCNRTGTLYYTMICENSISNLYIQTHQPNKALEHYKKYITAKDSIFNEENTKKTVRSEMNFEFQKTQDKQKAEQEKQDAIAQTEKQKQKIILILISCFLILVAVFAGFMFNRWRITQKQKKLIEKQKKLVDTAYHQIEEKNKEITDSINYASRIQQAMLTSEEYINKHLPADFFIFYQPKDIVSGDFYWAYNSPTHNGHFYIATADCTGHGVPGAFMSLLNINFLNENVIERNITEPNKILNEQRKEIIKALNPKGTENSKDGMDCVLCKFDFSSFEDGKRDVRLTYSAANNPLWIIRNQKNNSQLSTLNPELTEYKADKMPVGKYNEADKEFTQESISLQKGDTVYTFTDGYADQFGGSKGKKFKYKQLENLLLSINHLPMEEQQIILKQTINDWKGNLEQVDDILVIGIKI